MFEKYEVYCHQFQIRSSEMVRSDKIITNLDKLIQSFDLDLLQAVAPTYPETLNKMIKIEGVNGINNYLTSLKLKEISR